MSGIGILVRSIFTLSIFSGLTIPASADITTGGDGTIVNQSGNTFNITGGTPNGDGKNLFHSFGTFNLTTTPTILQVANFQPAANVQNILGRINGGLPSSIDGKIQVTGGDPKGVNLFLMNPAGIVFGKGASLDINGAFTATTAKAIDFKGKWFNAFGTNNYSELIGNPIGLAFGSGVPGSIFNAATISNAKPGQSITLVGGTVISTGDIKTAGGNISIATVEGGKYVQIKVEGSILGLNLPASVPTYINSINSAPTSFKQQSLAELLTNTKVDLAATGVKNEKGVVTLVGNPTEIAADIQLGDTVSKQNRSISSGDVITRNLDTSMLDKNGGNIYIQSSKAILSGKIDTSVKNTLPPNPPKIVGGNVILNAQTEIKTKSIITSSVNGYTKPGSSTRGYQGGNVILSTKTNDIIVDSIYAIGGTTGGSPSTPPLSKAESEGLRGGDITINSIGLFRVITSDNGGLSSSIISSLFGVIKIDHGSKKPFASGVEFSGRSTSEGGIPQKKPDFTFPDGASGSRGAIITSYSINGSVNTVYKDQPIDGISIAGNNTLVTPPVKNDQDKNPGGGKTGTDVATKPSGNNSEEKDPKDNSSGSSDNQASKPGDSEDDKQKAKKRKQKAKCNSSSAIASARLRADLTRSGNIDNSAAEELCPPNIDNGILQILIDRN